jgi:hypothetical protein
MSRSKINKTAHDIVRTQKWIQNNSAFPEDDSTANDLLTSNVNNETVSEWINILRNGTHVECRDYNYQLFIRHITDAKTLCLPVKSFPMHYNCQSLIDRIENECELLDKEVRIKYKFVSDEQIIDRSNASTTEQKVIKREDLFHNARLDSKTAAEQFNIYQSSFPAVFYQKGGSVSRFHVDAVHGTSYLQSGRKLWLCVPFDTARSLVVPAAPCVVQTLTLDLNVLRQCQKQLEWFVQEAGETVLVNPWCCHAVITFADVTPAVLISNNHIWRSAFHHTVAFNQIFTEPDFTPDLRQRTAKAMKRNRADPTLIQQWIRRKKSKLNSWLNDDNTI